MARVRRQSVRLPSRKTEYKHEEGAGLFPEAPPVPCGVKEITGKPVLQPRTIRREELFLQVGLFCNNPRGNGSVAGRIGGSFEKVVNYG